MVAKSKSKSRDRQPQTLRFWTIPDQTYPRENYQLPNFLRVAGFTLREVKESDGKRPYAKMIPKGEIVYAEIIVGKRLVGKYRGNLSVAMDVLYQDQPLDIIQINSAVALRVLLDVNGIPYTEHPNRDYVAQKIAEETSDLTKRLR